MELVEVFEAAVSDATEHSYATVNERWVRTALLTAANTHLRADGTVRGVLSEVQRAVADWVDEYRDKPQMAAGWDPRKFLSWLNGRQPSESDRPPPRTAPPPPVHQDGPPMTPAQRAEALRKLQELRALDGDRLGGKFI